MRLLQGRPGQFSHAPGPVFKGRSPGHSLSGDGDCHHGWGEQHPPVESVHFQRGLECDSGYRRRGDYNLHLRQHRPAHRRISERLHRDVHLRCDQYRTDGLSMPSLLDVADKDMYRYKAERKQDVYALADVS